MTRHLIPRFPSLSLFLLIALMMALCNQASAKPDYREIQWDRLDLSSQQRNYMEDQNDEWHSLRSEYAPRIESNKRKLKTLMANPDANEAEILRLQDAIHKDHTKLMMEARRIYKNKQKILNKDQQEKFHKMLTGDEN